MNDPLANDLDTALAAQLQAAPEPDDAGFSLRVMAALPEQRAPSRRRDRRLIQLVQWTLSCVAACGAAGLLVSGSMSQELSQTLAGLALLGLVVYWSVPSRWSRC